MTRIAEHKNIWKCFPLWHSKIFTHENKAHLWSSDWSLFPVLHRSESRSESLHWDVAAPYPGGHFTAWYCWEEYHIHTLDWNLNLTVKFLSCWKEQILLSNTVRTWLHIQDLHRDLLGDSLVICWIVFVLPFSSLGKVITNPDPSGIFTEFYTDMSSPSKALKHVGESGTLMYIFKLKVKLL